MIKILVYISIFLCFFLMLKANLVIEKDIIIYKAELLPIVADGILLVEEFDEKNNKFIKINLDLINESDSIISMPDFYLNVSDKKINLYKKWVEVEAVNSSMNKIKPKEKCYLNLFFKVPGNIAENVELIVKKSNSEKKFKLEKITVL